MTKTIAEVKFEELEQRRLNAEAERDGVELGAVLIDLSYHAKNHGVPGGSAFPRAQAYAIQAVEVLRRTSDRKLLASALRASDVSFVSPDVGPENLTEALNISREIGDSDGIVKALHRLAARAGMSGNPDEVARLNSEAARVATAAADPASLGSTRLETAIHLPKGPERERALVEAAELLVTGGNHAKAGYAYTWAWLNADSRDQKLHFLQRSAEEYRLGSDFNKLATALHSLQRFFNEEGDQETARHYKDQAAEFDEMLFGSRRARILYYKQMLEEMLPDTLELIEEMENGDDYTAREELRNSAKIYQSELDELKEDLVNLDKSGQ